MVIIIIIVVVIIIIIINPTGHRHRLAIEDAGWKKWHDEDGGGDEESWLVGKVEERLWMGGRGKWWCKRVVE